MKRKYLSACPHGDILKLNESEFVLLRKVTQSEKHILPQSA